MKIGEKLKTIWQILFGSNSIVSLSEMDELINVWLTVYRGKQEWLQYKYATLEGRIRERRRKTLNIAKMLCAEISGLIWSELPTVTTDDKVVDVLRRSNFFNKMKDFTERVMALGGGALKLRAENKVLYMDFIPADRFIPISWDDSIITEADFVDSRVVKGKEYIRVEKHRKIDGGYKISNEAYLIENGYKVQQPLSVIDENLTEETDVQITTPMFSYIRVAGDNNLVDDTPLGVSIYANALDTLEALDIAFDALNQEILLGKKRIIVPAGAVRKVVNPETGDMRRYFDPSDEVFQAFNSDDQTGLKITDNSVELRIDEIRQAIQTLLDILSIQIGLSAGFFSFDGSAVKTATEVISENSKTFKTKQYLENSFAIGITDMLNSIREMLRLYNVPISDNDYSVVFQDNIIEDRNTKTKYWTERYTTGTCTLIKAIMKIDSVDEKTATEEAEKIKAEKATVDIDTMFGGTDQ